nr:hypothetical protein [Tanacetum cinerariifolium]
MRQALTDRLRMVYTGAEGQELFTSHAWRRLFEIRAPLVKEFIQEFFSACRISDTKMEFYEMVEDGFKAYWLGSVRAILDKEDLKDYWTQISSDRDFLSTAPSYNFIRDPMRRLCHRLISFSIFGRGQAPEKVTATDLFYMRSMDQGKDNVSYLLPIVTASVPEVTECARLVDEGVLAVPSPMQAPHPPPTAAQTRTTP